MPSLGGNFVQGLLARKDTHRPRVLRQNYTYSYVPRNLVETLCVINREGSVEMSDPKVNPLAGRHCSPLFRKKPGRPLCTVLNGCDRPRLQEQLYHFVVKQNVQTLFLAIEVVQDLRHKRTRAFGLIGTSRISPRENGREGAAGRVFYTDPAGLVESCLSATLHAAWWALTRKRSLRWSEC